MKPSELQERTIIVPPVFRHVTSFQWSFSGLMQLFCCIYVSTYIHTLIRKFSLIPVSISIRNEVAYYRQSSSNQPPSLYSDSDEVSRSGHYREDSNDVYAAQCTTPLIPNEDDSFDSDTTSKKAKNLRKEAACGNRRRPVSISIDHQPLLDYCCRADRWRHYSVGGPLGEMRGKPNSASHLSDRQRTTSVRQGPTLFHLCILMLLLYT